MQKIQSKIHQLEAHSTPRHTSSILGLWCREERRREIRVELLSGQN